MTAAMLSGCGTIYLHSGAREAASKAARESFEKIDLSEIFEQQGKHLKALAADEKRVVGEYLVAVRDARLITLLSENTDNTQTTMERVAGWTAERTAKILFPKADGANAVTLLNTDVMRGKLKFTAAEWISASSYEGNKIANLAVAEMQTHKNNYLAVYKNSQGGKRPDPCGKDAAKDPGPENSTLDAVYAIAVASCKRLKDKYPASFSGGGGLGNPHFLFDGRIRDVLTTLGKLSGEPKDWKDPDVVGLYRHMEYQLWRETSAQRAQKKISTRLKAELKCIDDRYKAAVALEAAGKVGTAATTWSKEILAVVERLKSAKKAAADDVKKAAKGTKPPKCELDPKQQAFSQYKVPTLEEMIADADIDTNVLNDDDVVKKAIKLLGIQSRIDAFEIEKTELGKVLSLFAQRDPKTGKLPDDTSGKFAQAIRFVDALDNLQTIVDASKTPPNVISLNAIVVGRAFARYQADVARIEMAAMRQREAVIRDQMAALSTEVERLSEAYVRSTRPDLNSNACVAGKTNFTQIQIACKKSDPGGAAVEAGRILTLYNKAWLEGRFPYELGRYALIQVDRETSLFLQRESANARLALINAAIDEFVRFGAGGITQEQIAELAQLIGLFYIGDRAGD